MYKFQPILKSLIWGGEKIAPYKGIATDQRNIGESWELSGVKDNESVVAEGPEAGTSLPELIARHGAALLGKANYGRFGEEFPLLIKFIDARQDLSIQVHPNDELAWERHKSKGKTEMWYVVSADKDAHLRSGFSKQVTPAEYEASVGDNRLQDRTGRRVFPARGTCALDRRGVVHRRNPADLEHHLPHLRFQPPRCQRQHPRTAHRTGEGRHRLHRAARLPDALRAGAWSWCRALISPRRSTI